MVFLPLEDPILIFSLLLFIILVTPYIFKKIKIPHIVGLIVAGSVIGKNGIGFLQSDDHIKLFSTMGLLYIMFIASLEIDLVDFKKNSHKSLIFGMFTFLIPMILGWWSSKYILGLPKLTSIFIASVYASHTLLTYSIITQYNISKNRAVNVTIGGTIVTNILALLVLAVIVSSKGESSLPVKFWIDFILYIAAFGFIVFYAFPKFASIFFKNEKDSVAQYIFILAMLFLSAYLAKSAKIEAIIGAFLIGLSLNPLIPKTSPLKNRIDFIGNAIFIPIFLISVGMLIDFKVLFSDLRTILIAFTMIVVGTTSKYIAALFAQISFGYNKNERNIMFGLSNSQAAVTLAAMMVGYELKVNVGGNIVSLVGESLLNGSIMMILFTCTIASFATERGAYQLSLQEVKNTEPSDDNVPEKILIPISHPDTVEELVSLGLILKSNQYKNNIYALNVISSLDVNIEEEMLSKELLEKATKLVAATDQTLHELIRYDTNISNGICNIVKEHKISDMIIGLHQRSNKTESFLGKFTEYILNYCISNIYIYHSVQPFNTLKKLIVVIPEKADKEPCFTNFILKLINIANHASVKLIIYSSDSINKILAVHKKKHSFDVELINFIDWDDFLIISSKLGLNSGLLIYMSRPGSANRNDALNKISKYLYKYFEKYNYILYYPEKFKL